MLILLKTLAQQNCKIFLHCCHAKFSPYNCSWCGACHKKTVPYFEKRFGVEITSLCSHKPVAIKIYLRQIFTSCVSFTVFSRETDEQHSNVTSSTLWRQTAWEHLVIIVQINFRHIYLPTRYQFKTWYYRSMAARCIIHYHYTQRILTWLWEADITKELALFVQNIMSREQKISLRMPWFIII